MRIRELLSRIINNLDRNGLRSGNAYFDDAQILNYINQAQNQILVTAYPIRDILELNTYANVKDYLLPSYVGKISKVVCDDVELKPAGASDYLFDYGSGFPVEFYIFGSKSISFIPIPDKVYKILIEFYYQEPPVRADMENELWLPSYFDFAIEYLTLHNLYLSAGRTEASAGYYNLYLQALQSVLGHSQNQSDLPKVRGDW